MNEPDLDLELKARFERLADAVPSRAEPSGAPVPVAAVVAPRLAARDPVARPLLAAAAVVVLVASIAVVQRWQSTGVTGAAPVSASDTSGPFTLTITADRARYQAGDPMSVHATVEYGGPEASIDVAHDESGLAAFGITEPVEGMSVAPVSDLMCAHTTLQRDTPVTVPFSKSGGSLTPPPDPSAASAWFADPALRLRAGTWHLYAEADLPLTSCGGAGPQYHLRAEIQVTVGGSDTPVEPTLVPLQTQAEVGPIVDDVPTSLDGLPVLRGDALRAAIAAATDDTPLLAGGWFQGGYSHRVSYCTAFRPPKAIDTCANGLTLFDEQVGWTRTEMTGGETSIDGDPSALSDDRPVVLRIHTHDPACARLQATSFDCDHLPVLSAVAWLGPIATLRPSPTPVGTSPASSISRARAIELARPHAGEPATVSMTARCAEFAPYSQVWTDEIPPPQPDAWIWSIVFTGGRWRSEKVSLDYETGAFVTEMGADWLQSCLGEVAPTP